MTGCEVWRWKGLVRGEGGWRRHVSCCKKTLGQKRSILGRYITYD